MTVLDVRPASTTRSLIAEDYLRETYLRMVRQGGVHPLVALADYHNLSAAEIAELVGTTIGEIKELLAGNYKGLTDKLLADIVELFGLSSEEIFPHLFYAEVVKAAGRLEENTIRRLRRAEGLSQSALAERLGISQATISRLERNGRRGFNVGVANRVADYYGLPCEVVLPHMTSTTECGGQPGKIGTRRTHNRTAAAKICQECYMQMPVTGHCNCRN